MNSKCYINEVISICLENFPNKYNFSNKRQKYNINQIIDGICEVMETGISWDKYEGVVNKKTLFCHFRFLSKNNIFSLTYKRLADDYFTKSHMDSFKYQSVDSSFIPNKGGVEGKGRNKHYNNKKGTKLSIITQNDGMPISIMTESGNKSDIEIAHKNLDNMIINPNPNKYKNNNRYKQYFLADKGYDSSALRNKLKHLGYTSIIDHNKRNIKDPKKIKKLTKKEKVIYRKRIIVENTFCKLKNIKKFNCRYEKTMCSFTEFIYLAFIKIFYDKLDA
jgi:transposase